MRGEPEIEELDDRSMGPADRTTRPDRHAAGGRVGGSSSGTFRTVATVAVLLAIAIVKPWDALGLTASDASRSAPYASLAAGASAPAAGASGEARLSGQVATPSATPAPLQLDCGAPDGWRLVVVDWLAGRPSRMQSAATALPWVRDPTDPAIASLPAGEAPLAAVGACAPGPPPGLADDRLTEPPIRVVKAWRIDGATLAAVPLSSRGPAAVSAAAVQLYAPDAGTWGPGRYVLELAAGAAGVVWVGFSVEPAPGADVTPAVP